ncbi:MAG TPA: hypothetical protein VGC42_25090 [Kofleriaceae bacterium]
MALLLVVTACASSDPGADWQLVDSNEPASLLSVWGTSASDVWVSGGRSQATGAPTVLHRTGDTWSRVDSGARGVDLWWVFGFDGGDVLFSGSGGTILRYHAGAFAPMTTPRSGIVFGMWGASANDVWAVGKGDDGHGIVWHYDGTQWADAAPPAGGVPDLVLKVHGQRSDDVWISCGGGVTLHWDGAALSRVPSTVTSSLFSIVTTADDVVAVGGATGQGDILENAGAGWVAQPTLVPVAWRGVAAGGDRVYAVGEAGVVAQRAAGAWTVLKQAVTQLPFHAAWVDPEGGLWAVGGMFDTLPLTTSGFLTYYGGSSIRKVSP